jgi:nitrite reductase (NADH) small subunit
MKSAMGRSPSAAGASAPMGDSPRGTSVGRHWSQERPSTWRLVCELDEILPDAGVAAFVDGKQIAVFRIGDSVHAISNFDPHSNANVLSRGLVGDVQAEPAVASPIYKHHFSLITGRCIEDVDMSVPRRRRQRHGRHEGRGVAARDCAQGL